MSGVIVCLFQCGFDCFFKEILLILVIKMPQGSIVPFCPSRTYGHRFPSDLYLGKKWIVAIKRYIYKRTKKTRFLTSDYVIPRNPFLDLINSI